MNTKYIKLLQNLTDASASPVNISSLLGEMFPLGVSDDKIQKQSAEIKLLLNEMYNVGLISFESKSVVDGLGYGNRTGGYTSINNKNINVSITNAGTNYLDNIDEKKLSIALLSDNLETNKSNRKINDVTIENIKSQKSLQVWNMVLAIVTTVFVVITGLNSLSDKSDQKLESIALELKAIRKNITPKIKKRYTSKLGTLSTPDTITISK